MAARGSEPEPQPSPQPSTPEAPPEPPALSSLCNPNSGRGIVSVPEWNSTQGRFDHIERQMNARFAKVERVAQILIGEASTEGVVLNFYGETLTTGEYQVMPATDESRAQHANRDNRVLLVTVGQRGEGDLRSHSGTVTISDAADDSASGSFDVTLRSRNMMRETVVRGRFAATYGRLLEAELEHQRDIREQMRMR